MRWRRWLVRIAVALSLLQSLCVLWFVFSFTDEVRYHLASALMERQMGSNDWVREHADEIRRDCEEWRGLCEGCYEDCMVYHAENAINEIPYRDDSLLQWLFMLDDDPDYTVEHGNDCDGRAVLLASLLRELGFERIAFVFQDWDKSNGHACVLEQDTRAFLLCAPEKSIRSVVEID